jgi:hypothetical protein
VPLSFISRSCCYAQRAMRGWRGGSDAHRYRVGAVRLDARITAGGSQAPQRGARLLSAAGFSMEMTVHPYSVQDAYIYGFALQEWDMLTESAADFAAKAQRQMDEYQAVLADHPHVVEVVGGVRR